VDTDSVVILQVSPSFLASVIQQCFCRSTRWFRSRWMAPTAS
jgi:hypothetical protein